MTTDLDGILARLERLEAENAALRREVRPVLLDGAVAPDRTAASLSRRQLLRRAGVSAMGVGALALTAVGVIPASGALADGEPINVGDDITDAQSTTIVRNEVNDETVLQVQSDGAGTGLLGISAHGRGVLGTSSTGIGVTGYGTRGGTFLGVKAAINLGPA